VPTITSWALRYTQETLRFLDLLHQIIDGHGFVSIGGLNDRALAPVAQETQTSIRVLGVG